MSRPSLDQIEAGLPRRDRLDEAPPNSRRSPSPWAPLRPRTLASPSSSLPSPSPPLSTSTASGRTPSGNLGSDAKSPPPPASLYSAESQSNPSFLRRLGTNWGPGRRKSDDPEEGIRGELGLRPLHLSSDPLIDLVFVHGLRGGSVKTWRKGADPRFFWPQFWLPMEKGFERASIHTFGYDSDWGTTKQSVLNVHDFGRALFEELRTSQHLRGNDESPIILIGHSMGGLVIKKAFILAHQDSSSPQLGKRIRCIFFLATPHRGSDFAALLKNVLKASRVPKEYVTDLTAGSTSTQIINEDFPQYTGEVALYSFWETLPMTLGGVSTGLVVDKNSAVLGYKDERSTFLHANHRDICKFDGHDDPNWIKFRDVLGSAVDGLLRDVILIRQHETRAQLRVLQAFLGVQAAPEEHFEKAEGSCEWIHEREDFNNWRDSPYHRENSGVPSPTFYWVSANPGTGKSVLASHVVSHLQSCKLKCAFYHFHFGKKTAQTLGGFLRSIAYQMARSNNEVRQTLLDVHEDGLTFDHDDAYTIWIKLFKDAIFQTSMFMPQYWVIDAVDECRKVSELFTWLRGAQTKFPLCIFVTSRRDPVIRQYLRPMEAQVTSTEIPVDDTMADIKSYIDSRIEELPLGSNGNRSELCDHILGRSDACFLWVRLVMDELRNVCAHETIPRVLKEIPRDMVAYYERTVSKMTENTMERHISKAMLIWVTVAARPLTIDELTEILELDVGSGFDNMPDAIERLCGQLIVIDKTKKTLHIVHATARDFLFTQAAGEFMISKDAGGEHERIALICLRLLCRRLEPPKSRRHVSGRLLRTSGLLDYAVAQFSEHIYGASTKSNEVFRELKRFLSTNILALIELLSLFGNLQGLVRIAKNVSHFLAKRTKYHSPLDAQMVSSWCVNLSRLVTKFGKALISSPSCIYYLIPPLCPTQSSIYETFGQSRRTPGALQLVGFENSVWDDCIATVKLEDETASAVACGKSSIAVGMESGNVRVFHDRSFQQTVLLPGQYPIDVVHHVTTGRYLAVSSSKFLSLWDIEASAHVKPAWATRIRSRCMTMASTSSELIGITEHGRVIRWDLATGDLIEQHSYPHMAPELEDLGPSTISRAPGFASLSPDMEVLALAYRSGPVCLWDFQQKELIGYAVDERDSIVNHIMFNPNPEVELLLVAYSGSALALYDKWSGEPIECHYPEHDTNYQSISASPDGHTAATMDVIGNLRIWDFETLTPLYEVQTSTLSVRILSFTSDGANIVDTAHADSTLKIWSPASLVRKKIGDDDSTSATEQRLVKGQYASLTGPKITFICAHPSKPVVFASNSVGQVLSYDTKTGRKQGALYVHPNNAYVRDIAVSSTGFIASSDVYSTLQVRTLEATGAATFKADQILLQVRFSATVRQLLFSTSSETILVSTRNSAHVYDIRSGELIGSLQQEPAHWQHWMWIAMNDQTSGDALFGVVMGQQLVLFPAATFPGTGSMDTLRLPAEVALVVAGTSIDRVVHDVATGSLLIDTCHRVGFTTHSTLSLYRLSPMENGDSPTLRMALEPFADKLSSQSAHFIGMTKGGKSAVFLNKESWIDSIELGHKPPEEKDSVYARHFFAPNELTSRLDEMLPVMTADDDVVFPLHGELAIVKNGMKFIEMKEVKFDS